MSATTQNEKSIEEKQQVFQNATITATKSAVKRLKGVMAADGKEDHFLRMSVEGGGCSGMTYKMDFENEKGEFDKEFESNGLTIICDLKSWLYLKDIEVDYSDDLLNGGFKIKNPNAERTCGCGTSFSA
ncbi:MAG TPA: iron-sulfur cluster assembly accessory protein [Candidatus Marinimicrobia bacterium]|jgi:iron-sulfur cluster assembly protein|nr:iron-sulfur cluster assembly accessory protein [Candidatus Neomarinimicrobiota bacterium]|tara:strand:+ start:119 stop:505 length:387 start_codon:yes stop_codon:yes gene_type:complete